MGHRGIVLGDVATTRRGEPPAKPRICIPTFSAFAPKAFRARLYEAEDILAECDDVELIQLKPTGHFSAKSRWMKQIVMRDLSRKVIGLNPGLEPVRLSKDYDLFVLICGLWWPDIWFANAVRGWKDRCRISVCWIDELWIRTVRELKRWLPILEQFDYVLVATSGTAGPLSESLGRRCYEMLGGVDAIRFSPYPKCPERVIDFYSVGRAPPPVHQCVLKWADDQGLFYIHDTMSNLADCDTLGHAQHRNVYANMAKRSRLFAVAPGKFDAPAVTQGQVVIGARYFEGLAAGAVLVGQAPHCETYRTHFDWPQAVVEILPDGSDTVETLSRLLAEPERLRAMSARNAAEGLKRHDWVYRWREILRIAGLEPRPALAARERRLAELAEMAMSHAS